MDAWYNHWADRAAGAICQLVSGLPAFHSLVRRYMFRRLVSRMVHDFQVQVAFVFASQSKGEQPEPVPVVTRHGEGIPMSPYGVCIESSAVKHVGFARKLASGLVQLEWFPGAVGHSHSDVSWLELFWGFIHDTSCLPPLRVGSSWVSVDDDISFGFVLPTVKELFRTWRCCLDCLVRGGLVVPWVVLRFPGQLLILGPALRVLVFLATLSSQLRPIWTCLFSLPGLGVWLISGPLPFTSF